ncbi:hypothetical protein BOSE62_30461 [Bosea sp. 62]|nr:hypothetical protein BOSE21B_111149 [Bosea sp. 21B]CAD5273041.1 hypothetical protein BOSE7B_30244 [Bosea sp. 7B]VVT56073.1 hypothetical protein BOS5A_130180 [Bosea sp. EC-HK365B]VXB80238.1 hypothetical protein BOSE29B_130002 [Bosea sp. 29B]VXC18429.1 hypothetical protein BOSE125_180127 [Bosea sp. 125]VXC22595.1 hypothetical protein BOSE62_30461 [Bosea sp. 62]VXC71945.1 hypothetical protein BOSE127_40243 [Bosea sp. 127]
MGHRWISARPCTSTRIGAARGRAAAVPSVSHRADLAGCERLFIALRVHPRNLARRGGIPNAADRFKLSEDRASPRPVAGPPAGIGQVDILARAGFAAGRSSGVGRWRARWKPCRQCQ